MSRWLECPVCHGVFAFIREQVTLRRFMLVQEDDYEDWDGLFFERHSDIRCIDCGRLAAELSTSPFELSNVREGTAPYPRAMLTAIGKCAELDAVETTQTMLSVGSYCTLDERRKLIVPRLRELGMRESDYLKRRPMDDAFTARVEKATLAKGGHILTNMSAGMVTLLVEMDDHDVLCVWTVEHAFTIAEGLRQAALAVMMGSMTGEPDAKTDD